MAKIATKIEIDLFGDPSNWDRDIKILADSKTKLTPELCREMVDAVDGSLAESCVDYEVEQSRFYELARVALTKIGADRQCTKPKDCAAIVAEYLNLPSVDNAPETPE